MTDDQHQPMGQPMEQPIDPVVPDGPLPDPALASAVLEIEQHIASAGWDQPARLYALVNTGDLVQAEPALAAEMGLDGQCRGPFTPIEQELTADVPLETVLASIMWPEQVTVRRGRRAAGAAADVDGSIPDDATAAQAFAEDHRPPGGPDGGRRRAPGRRTALRLRAQTTTCRWSAASTWCRHCWSCCEGRWTSATWTRTRATRRPRRERWHVRRRRARGREQTTEPPRRSGRC